MEQTERINQKIKRIFTKHKIKPVEGDEGFWLAVEKVQKKSKTDASKLKDLAAAWDVAFKQENR